MLEQVNKSIQARAFFRRGQKILVAVSGGVDSMVLLHLLHTLSKRASWKLTVAHFNHQLRGNSSRADERLVSKTARDLGLPFVAGRADVRRHARIKKISIELAARELRHRFLARTASRLAIPSIALAHHVDDRVELFFLRLLRGSGGEGLAGMNWRNPSPANPEIELVRPLLEATKLKLAEYAAEQEIGFREDRSNDSLDFNRNRVRHRLLPLLKKEFQPALEQVVWRSMEIVGAESEAVNAVAARWLKVKKRQRFAKLPIAVQRRALHEQLLALGMSPEFQLIEKLRIQADRPITVGTQQLITRDRAGTLTLSLLEETSGSRAQQRQRQARVVCHLQEAKSGEVLFSGKEVSWKIEPQRGVRRPTAARGREWFDVDKAGRAVTLRHWQPGDRFQPIGMKSAVKLQDLFVNAKIPRAARHRLIVAETESGEIFWVEGLRIGERFKLNPQTSRRLRWEWRVA